MKSSPCLLAALAAAALLAGCGQGGATSTLAPAPTQVGVITLQPQRLVLKSALAGRTVAAQSAEIRPQVNGIVTARLFTEGATVKAGQPLYRLDAGSYQVTVDSAQAALARSHATLLAAELKAQRQQDLLAIDAVTKQDAEDAQAALQQARADLKTAEAALAAARIDLARTVITSPIAGRVDTSAVTAGALVTANQATPLTTVLQTDPMWVDIPQSSVELLKLRSQLERGTLKGGTLSVNIVLEDGSPYAHAGKLQVNGASVNTGTGAVTVRASVPNPDGLLLPGMYVRAVLDQAEDPAALLVPQQAVQRDPNGAASAWVVDADGKVEQRPVSVAEAVNGQWRITQGLKAGERIVVEGTGKVRPGQIVQAVSAGASAPMAVATR